MLVIIILSSSGHRTYAWLLRHRSYYLLLISSPTSSSLTVFSSLSFSFKPLYFSAQYLPLSMSSPLNVSPSQYFSFSMFPLLNVFPSQCFCLSIFLPHDVLGFFMEGIILDIIQCINAVAVCRMHAPTSPLLRHRHRSWRGDICNYHDTNKI